MKTFLYPFILLLLFQLSLDAQVAKRWDVRFGGTLGDGCYGLIQTPDGGYLLAGTSASVANGDKTAPNQGDFDYWVVKTGDDGTKQWDQSLGGNAYEELWTVQPSGENYLLGGYSNSGLSGDKTEPSRGASDYWVVLLDPQGHKIWDRRFGGTNVDELTTILPTRDGNFLLGGYSSSGAIGDKTQPSRGGYDYWIVLIDSNGNKLWDRRYGGPSYDFLYSLQSTTDGGFLLAGHSFSGIGGDKSQASRGGYDYWVIKIDAAGNKVWDKSFGGNNNDYCYGMEITPDNHILLAGYSYSGVSGDKTASSRGGTDYWVVHLDDSGGKIWDQAYGGSLDDRLYSIAPTSEGRYLLTGDSRSGPGGDKTEPSRGDFDAWIVAIDQNGNRFWDKTFGGSGLDYFLPALQTSDNGFLFAGGSQSGNSGDRTQPNWGDWDFWVVKTTANCAEIDLAAEADLLPASCPDMSDGTISVAVTGGTAPYIFNWSTDATATSIADLPVGVYGLTIEEASGCQEEFTYDLGVAPSPLDVVITPCQTVFRGYTPPYACAFLTLDVAGGCPPYTYSWSTGETTAEINVCPGETMHYTATVLDAAGQIWVGSTEVEVLDIRCGNNLDKVLVCHVPPDNPENARTKCVAPEAVPGMLMEGSYLGPCDWESCSGYTLARAIADGKLDPDLIVGRATGWEEPEPQPELFLFPNPAGDFLVADLRFFPEGKYDISIFDERGTMLISQQIEIPGSIGWQADLRTYPSGLYWIQVRGEETLVNEKFVVKSLNQ